MFQIEIYLFIFQIKTKLNTETSYFESSYIKPNLDCNNTFPIDASPNGIPFGVKSIDE